MRHMGRHICDYRVTGPRNFHAESLFLLNLELCDFFLSK